MFATLDDLRAQLGGHAALSPAYREKMLHPLPTVPTVDREAFIVKRCTGKRVLEFGASGALTDQIQAVAAQYWGVDREDGLGGWRSSRIIGYDLDDVSRPYVPAGDFRVPDDYPGSTLEELVGPDILICGEILEHLSNPGHFLTRLKRQYAGVPLLVTTPNAFVRSAWLEKGLECVNVDHVAWYSPRTLTTLLTRHGYTILDWACYNGTAPYAEGLIVVAV